MKQTVFFNIVGQSYTVVRSAMRKMLQVVWWALATYDIFAIIWCTKISHFTQKAVGLTNFSLARLVSITGLIVNIVCDSGARWMGIWILFAASLIFCTSALENLWRDRCAQDLRWSNPALRDFRVPRLMIVLPAHAMAIVCMFMPEIFLETVALTFAAVVIYLASCTPLPPGSNRLRERLRTVAKNTRRVPRPQGAAT